LHVGDVGGDLAVARAVWSARLYLAGDPGKALPRLSRAGRFDGRVGGQQVGLRCNAADQFGNLAYPLPGHAQSGDEIAGIRRLRDGVAAHLGGRAKLGADFLGRGRQPRASRTDRQHRLRHRKLVSKAVWFRFEDCRHRRAHMECCFGMWR
jgi:hypothetical protein